MIQKAAVHINFGEDSIVILQCTVFARVEVGMSHGRTDVQFKIEEKCFY
jgi:hypothetical protein